MSTILHITGRKLDIERLVRRTPLEPERNAFFRIDSEWLVIRFASSSAKVTEYRIVRD
jgi:hypothetical protein